VLRHPFFKTPIGRLVQVTGGAALLVRLAELLRDWELSLPPPPPDRIADQNQCRRRATTRTIAASTTIVPRMPTNSGVFGRLKKPGFVHPHDAPEHDGGEEHGGHDGEDLPDLVRPLRRQRHKDLQ
jgi:hypothetical protein